MKSKKQHPSIFNDVIGPVMRGPSSSHCAGSLRIGRMIRNLMGDSLRDVLIEYDPNGSLVTTHESQGSDMGLYGGLLGYETWDRRLLHYRNEVKKAGIAVRVKYVSYGATHPNTYRITAVNDSTTHRVTALSVGGGMIELVEIDGGEVRMQGDRWETIVFLSETSGNPVRDISSRAQVGEVTLHKCRQPFVRISTTSPLSASVLHKIKNLPKVMRFAVIDPVLPVISHPDVKLPFTNAGEMIRFNQNRGLPLWKLAVAYESARGNISEAKVVGNMREIVRICDAAIQSGLKGTRYADRILPAQSPLFKKKMTAGKLIADPVLNRIILYVSALMETKSAMGVIVAAPTAGACGALPGAILGAGQALKRTEIAMARAMLAAGLVGVFIAGQSTFAAESAGCQAECGSASGMAAAGLVQLHGGDFRQALGAASMALQNSFGMTCDPIANRVEAPCLGKNVMAAANALSCANMALAGYDPLIPLDEVLSAFDTVGRSLPRELRCTALGGLSVTKTSERITRRLLRRKQA